MVIKNLRFTKRCILLSIILLLLGILRQGLADPESPKPARFMLGYYSPSITEIASRSDIEVSMNFWAKELISQSGQEIGINITEGGAILFDTMDQLSNAVDRGDIDMVVAPPIQLVRYFKRDDLQDGFIGVLSNKRPENILVISRRDKNITSINDLKGKQFLLPVNDEFAEIYLDSLFLENFHKPVREIARSIENENKANRIVLDIYFNKGDVGVVYLSTFEVMSELNPDIAQKLSIVAQYPIKSRNFGFFLRNYPLAKKIMDLAISTVNRKNQRAKQILEVFKTEELDICKVQYLDAYDKFYQRYQALKKKYQP